MLKPSQPILALFLAILLMLLAFSVAPAEAQECARRYFASSPPPIMYIVTSDRDAATVWAEHTWVETVQATGSMRPAVQDGAQVILIPPEVGLLIPGRVILFSPSGQTNLRILHRIYAEGIDSTVPSLLLGTGPSGFTLAWDGRWYEPKITPPSPPLASRYWLTWGDNNCLPDFWQVRYSDILGIMVGVIE